MMIPQALHFVATALILIVSSIGVTFGQAKMINNIIDGILRQPSAENSLKSILIYGIILLEGVFVLCFILSISLALKPASTVSMGNAIAEFGVALGMSISTLFIGFAAGSIVKEAAASASKLPQEQSKIKLLLLILLTITETPAILTFVSGLFILNSLSNNISINDGFKFFSAALVIGIGSVGPSISQVIFGARALRAAFFEPANFNKIFVFSLLTEMIIETGVFFPFFMSILLITKDIDPVADTVYTWAAFLSAALCCSLGGMVSSIQISKIGRQAIKGIEADFKNYDTIFSLSFLLAIIVETCGLFSFIVSLFILNKFTL